MRSYTRCIILIMAAILAIILLQRTKILPEFSTLLKSRPVLIENTPLLVKEIRELTQLITVTSHDEVVVDSVKGSAADMVRIVTGLTLKPFAPLADRLVIIAKGSVQAGTDLRAMTEQDIYVEDDSVAVKLPRAEILEVIVNPSGFTTFVETGDWPPDAVSTVKARAKRKIEVRAVQKGILTMAEQRSKLLMENFLHTAGFKKVNVFF
jgi:hypothetical protein